MAVKLVNNIMQAEDAEETFGCTPIASMSGPLTIPPPTPNIPIYSEKIEIRSVKE